MKVDANNAVDLAWAAGLFEGEGCFTRGTHTFIPKNTGMRKSLMGTQHYVYFRAILSMTDKDVVKKFHRIVGIGTVSRYESAGNRLTQWRWQSSGEDAKAVFHMLRPYLGKRRVARAKELLRESR